MNELVKQAPEGLDIKIIKEVYERNNEDLLKSLMELWEIKEETQIKTENESKWDTIRETCDAYDLEMVNFMKKNRVKL